MKNINLVHVVDGLPCSKSRLNQIHLEIGGGVLYFNYHFLLLKNERENLEEAMVRWLRKQIGNHTRILTSGLSPKQSTQWIEKAFPGVIINHSVWTTHKRIDESSEVQKETKQFPSLLWVS